MDLEIDRSNFRVTRLVEGQPVAEPPEPGTARLRVESFGLTANNVTYAATGDLIGYWTFYPASDPGWGRVPVWGHAAVVASAVDDVEPGARCFGFLPMSTEFVVQPGSVGLFGFNDVSSHRAELPQIYNRYSTAAAADDADLDAEARTSLLQPLFATSFLIDDWLGAETMFGAGEVVISSASSKVALGLAHQLRVNDRGIITGLTSSRNAGFVEQTGLYDEVITYDRLPDGLGDGDAVYVDLAGDPAVLAAVHGHYADRLRRSVGVGMTHPGGSLQGAGGLPGPRPEFFFAPDHIRRRSADWGPAGLGERIGEARSGFEQGAGALIEIDRRHGPDAIAAAWTEAVDGVADPRRGVICSWDPA